jgi:type III secretory pathway lipoprotein EscJ
MEQKYLKLLRLLMNEKIPVHLVTESKNIFASNALITSVDDEHITLLIGREEKKTKISKISSIGTMLPK